MLESFNPKSITPIRSDAKGRLSRARRSLVLVAQPGTIAECSLFAIQREFPWVTTEHCTTMEEVGVTFDDPVSLFLVDRTFLIDIDRNVETIRRFHPAAAVALVLDDLTDTEALLPTLLGCKAIRGALPMNLKLDLWLSILGLFLRGGEYYPAALFHSCVDRRDASPSSRETCSSASGNGAPGLRDDRLRELTERERQVLSRVARGTQNKLIASELGLSEHTIKIHLHNIIRKLRVHNRTEAAAIFLHAAKERADQPNRI